MSEQNTNPEPYGPKNPPPSMEDALDRLREIETRMESIQTQLQTTSNVVFATDEEYRTWQKRASSALGHCRTEKSYLERWMGAGDTPHLVGNASTAGARAALERLIPTVKQKRIGLQARYSPLFSQSNQPPDVEVARERLAVLSPLLSELTDFFTLLRQEVVAQSVQEGALKSVKQPLLALNEQIKAEAHFLNKYLNEKRGDFVSFLLVLVERAMTEGLQLSEGERENLERIRVMREARFKRST